MRTIELTVLLKPDVKYKNETDPNKIPINVSYARLERIINALSVQLVKQEMEGIKRLAYKIDGFNCAVYVFYELEVEGRRCDAVVGVLNDLLLKEPDVLRHLAIPVD